MSSPAAREARRKAILSRGTDRLSKLTSSARGEDHPAYSNVETTTRGAPTTETFVGEESIMPTPPAVRASPASEPAHSNTTASDQGPTAWSPEQQQEFFRALLSAPEPTRAAEQASFEPSAGDDPFSAMLNAFAQMAGQAPPPGAANEPGTVPQATEVASPSLFAKLRPLLHLIATWILLAFFAFSMEPKAYGSVSGSEASNTWERWAELARRSAKAPFGVQPVPFFWAFVTLQLMLHSIQILTKSDPVQPPVLLAVVLPSLPTQWRTLITNFLIYARMFGMLLDDIAGLIVGIGILVFLSSWLIDSQ